VVVLSSHNGSSCITISRLTYILWMPFVWSARASEQQQCFAYINIKRCSVALSLTLSLSFIDRLRAEHYIEEQQQRRECGERRDDEWGVTRWLRYDWAVRLRTAALREECVRACAGGWVCVCDARPWWLKGPIRLCLKLILSLSLLAIVYSSSLQ
jgi:hypothetical protein